MMTYNQYMYLVFYFVYGLMSLVFKKVAEPLKVDKEACSSVILESPPCRDANPQFVIMMWCMPHKQPVSALWRWKPVRIGGRGVLEQRRWLDGAQEWEKKPLAIIPQRNEESRGGQHREGEKRVKKEKEGERYFPWRAPQTFPRPLNNTIQKITHMHKHTTVMFRSLSFGDSGCTLTIQILVFNHTNMNELNVCKNTNADDFIH